MRRPFFLGALAAFGLAGTARARAAAPRSPGDVALVDQNGRPFRLADLSGRPIVVTFVATRCRDTCPIANAIFSKLARERSRARLVTISLDPDFDTPFVMARYARELDARVPAWHLATGRPHDVERVLAAFGVVRERDAAGVPDVHSSFVYVLDRRGRLANTFPLSSNTIADVRATLARPLL